MQNHSRFIETNSGHKLHITDIGSGQPVLFIPGWPLSHEIFKFQFDFFSKRGYRTIGITLRGFGCSDKPETNYNFEEFAEDIQSVIDNLKLDDAIVCGFSMGGFIASYYLAKHQPRAVSKLVLFSCNAPSTTIQKDYPFGISRDAFDELILLIEQDASLITNVYGPLFQLNQNTMLPVMGNWINSLSRQASKSAMVKSMIATRDTDLRSLLPKILVPTMIFHALNDNVIPYEIAEEAQKLISNSNLSAFKTGGHWIFLLEKERFNSELLNFIAGYI
jgi:pimeloyl-ACP methyl ester carboxylesterase